MKTYRLKENFALRVEQFKAYLCCHRLFADPIQNPGDVCAPSWTSPCLCPLTFCLSSAFSPSGPPPQEFERSLAGLQPFSGQPTYHCHLLQLRPVAPTVEALRCAITRGNPNPKEGRSSISAQLQKFVEIFSVIRPII